MISHYGNPLGEQRQLLAGQAVVVRDDEVVLEIAGPDAKTWLHSLSSQNIVNLTAGESAETLILSPTGQIEHQLKVVVTDESLLIITAEDKQAALIAWLEKMKFRSKVEIKPTTKRVVGSFTNLGLSEEVWLDPWGQEPLGSVRYGAKNTFDYREYVVPENFQITHPKAGLLAYQALRIAAGRPEITDVDERSLPHEYDWLASAVHLSKGCYRGQETVAKVHNLGHPPRRAVILNLEVGDTIANPGEVIGYGDKEVGKVLAGALHFELGSIALGLVARVTPYLDLTVAGQTASQQVLVPADAGKAANLPRPSAFKLSGKK
ncbi:MAG: hypothetical protein RL068_40 [Actinomycetota bacterium]|jgi:folate-binding protein YgfZ